MRNTSANNLYDSTQPILKVTSNIKSINQIYNSPTFANNITYNQLLFRCHNSLQNLSNQLGINQKITNSKQTNHYNQNIQKQPQIILKGIAQTAHNMYSLLDQKVQKLYQQTINNKNKTILPIVKEDQSVNLHNQQSQDILKNRNNNKRMLLVTTLCSPKQQSNPQLNSNVNSLFITPSLIQSKITKHQHKDSLQSSSSAIYNYYYALANENIKNKQLKQQQINLGKKKKRRTVVGIKSSQQTSKIQKDRNKKQINEMKQQQQQDAQRRTKKKKIGGLKQDLCDYDCTDSINSNTDLRQSNTNPSNNSPLVQSPTFTLYLKFYRIQDQTSQFLAFQRKNYQKWHIIEPILRGLESFAIKYQIQNAQLHPQNIIWLACQSQKNINKIASKNINNKNKGPKLLTVNINYKSEQLYKSTGNSNLIFPPFQYLRCFQYPEQISQNSKFAQLKFFGKKGRQVALIKIQSYFRMWILKNKYNKIKLILSKVKKIQNAWRAFLRKKGTKLLIKTKNLQVIQRYKQRQKNFKKQYSGKINQTFKNMKIQKHVQLHIPSSIHQQMKRLTTQKYLQKQNEQITRIFRLVYSKLINKKNLTSELSEIIYVSAFPIQDTLLDYFYKILQIAGVEEPRSRITFIWPQVWFDSCSMCHNLLYSPKCLKRIKNLIKGKWAYIIPGANDPIYIKISEQLGLPLYAGQAQTSLFLQSKTGCRTAIREIIQSRIQGNILPFDMLPYRQNIYTKQDLLISIAQLIQQYPQVQRWFLKIQDENKGRGNAYIDTKSLVGQNYQFLRKRSEKSQKQIHHEINNDEEQYLKQILNNGIFQTRFKSKLKVIYNRLYSQASQFITQFLTHGGIVEASPSCLQGTIKTFGYFCQINPNGQYKMMGKYLKIGMNHKTSGYQYVKQSQKPDTKQFLDWIQKIAKNIYNTYGIIGFINIDFLEYKIPKTLINMNTNISSTCNNQLYFLGLDCHLTAGSSSFFAATSLSNSVNPQYLYCPLIIHPGLNQLQIKSFFHLCRLQNISFDIKRSIGSIFLLLDTLQAGTLGLLSLCDNTYGLYKYMLNSLDFLTRKLTPPIDNLGSSSNNNSRTDLLTFAEIRNIIASIVKYHEKKSKKQGNKQFYSTKSLNQQSNQKTRTINNKNNQQRQIN